MEMDNEIHFEDVRPIGSVPEDILIDPEISSDARLVLAWMVSRGERWKILVWYLKERLDLSDYMWRKVREELKERGYYQQYQKRGEDGKLHWVKKVTNKQIYFPPKRKRR
ncbi:hypothetical protein V5T82_16890 [Magnetovibrio sp. PR-2]|uniref:hypothetical protein n=1 Tax=Magnetovibrio sp. PR-2 TaxID=3120356 RepID=UPI002FCE47D3